MTDGKPVVNVGAVVQPTNVKGWQPIATAPKDGSEVILGFDDSADMDFYRWNADLAARPDHGMPAEQYGWADRTSDPPHAPPTHWMPRPDPPEGSA